MIKNVSAGFLALACLVGCGRADATDPEPFQGVVEFEDRTLGFEVAGRVLAVAVDRGDAIEPGAVLVRLDDGLERPLRDARRAELDAAEAQLRLLTAGPRSEEIRGVAAQLSAARSAEALAERNLERQSSLLATGAVAVARTDEVQGQLNAALGQRTALEQQLRALRSGARPEDTEAAQAQVRAAAAALSAVEERLGRYVLSASSPGDVIDVHVLEGEVVAPGAPALTVADLDHPYVEIFVPQARASEARVGRVARISVDSVPSALTGRVEHVHPRTEFTPRFLFSESERPNLVVRVRVRIDDPEHVLHAGLPAFVTLDEAPRE